ncbi:MULTISPECIES: ash family protein [Aeromonas]|uniref:ash family protein n=1 Tax=Aeromonas TaxID=642 RepID=UPI000D6490E2|nr:MULTISPECIES: ash family protein [Aeromonas]QXB96533.1 ash family protein [Aeromonas sp. FDAARGOS 1406]
MKEQYGLTAQGEASPKFQGVGLSHNVQRSTIPLAAAKSVAEIGVSESVLEPTHALAWFFVGTRSPFLGALLAYLVGSAYRVMAARARALQGALDPKVSSYANLVRAVTRRLASICGSDNLLTLEAAIMATVPTPALPKIFTFLIQRPRVGRLAELRRIRTIAIIANTEAQARANLPGLSLVFMSRTPSKGVAA